MFKKFTLDDVSSQSQIKSSVGRGIRSTLLDLYPNIEEVIDDILPKKDNLIVAKCTNHVQILVLNKSPMFFQYRDGPWFPTLRTVCVNKGPRTSMKDAPRGAIKFVVAGANIMCPGFTHEDGDMSAPIDLDAPVIVTASGKRHAMCVGKVKMTNEAIIETNKGIAVENLHFLDDGLWQLPQLD